MTEKELKYILEQGEGYRIEFKEQIAGLDKEMVAFANASGGFIYLGIEAVPKLQFWNSNLEIHSFARLKA
jgi:predicted HTH transcriptional regulator